MYEGDCNQVVVFLFTLNYLNVRNNEYNYKFFRQILKLEGLQGQRAAIVIRLHYEEEKQKAKTRQGNRTDLTSAPIGAKVENKRRSKVLAEKAGVGQGSITRLITVYRNRSDLCELVFDKRR